jgi:hypothetical protein
MQLRRPTAIVVAALSAALIGGVATAHHSFAVFFDDEKIITVKGTVIGFRFTNPHGTIEFTVGSDTWRAETNAPTLLRRRGWTRDSLKPGEAITIEGWPARDGSRYMRMRSVTRSDGTVLGTPVLNQRVD